MARRSKALSFHQKIMLQYHQHVVRFFFPACNVLLMHLPLLAIAIATHVSATIVLPYLCTVLNMCCVFLFKRLSVVLLSLSWAQWQQSVSVIISTKQISRNILTHFSQLGNRGRAAPLHLAHWIVSVTVGTPDLLVFHNTKSLGLHSRWDLHA